MQSFATSVRLQPPQQTPELWRIVQLPRRTWTPEQGAEVARYMTQMLRTPHGTMQLRPIQGIALFEIGYYGGMFAPIRVSGGKTLISLLAPVVAQAQRPALVVPAKLVEKTKRERRTLSYHWRLPVNINIVSFELLGREQAADWFKKHKPDCIILDESHKTKDKGAAVTRRLLRWLQENPTCKLIAMTGTISKRSIKDYAHHLRYTHKANSPLPLDHSDLEAWADAIDVKQTNASPGALLYLCTNEERQQGIDGVRAGYRRRLNETPGYVATEEDPIGVPIVIDVQKVPVPFNVQYALSYLRQHKKTPDGEPFADALTLWRHCRELALGFYYRWNPWPPAEWLDARKEWSRVCNYILTYGRRETDSELQVIRAVDQGHYPYAEEPLRRWRAIRDTFKPNTEPVWISDYMIHYVRQHWNKPALIWVEHNAFGERLSQVAGWPYYSRLGRDARGRSILDHPANRPAICSMRSIGEGFNLQHFSKNLCVSVFTNGKDAEQIIGRTHRDGQTADEVEFTLIETCPEHASAIVQVREDARYIEATTGQPQKLNIADWS